MPPDLSLRPGEVGPVRGGTPGIRSKLTQTVAEGARVGSLLVIDTPGHIHGHQAFLDERDGTLYAGDEFGVMGKLTITGFMPWWFPLKAFSNREQARETAMKLQAYAIPPRGLAGMARCWRVGASCCRVRLIEPVSDLAYQPSSAAANAVPATRALIFLKAISLAVDTSSAKGAKPQSSVVPSWS